MDAGWCGTVVVLPDLFPRKGGAAEFRGDPTVGFQGLDQRSKMEEVVPKMTHRRSSDARHPEGDELDPADDVRRCCKKKAVTVAAKSEQLIAGETGKGQFLWGNGMNMAERESCEKDFISRQYSGYDLSLQWPGLLDWEHGWMGVPLRFWRASLPVCYREVQRDRGCIGSLELHERSQISQKDFGWRNAGALERRPLPCGQWILAGERVSFYGLQEGLLEHEPHWKIKKARHTVGRWCQELPYKLKNKTTIHIINNPFLSGLFIYNTKRETKTTYKTRQIIRFSQVDYQIKFN